MSHVSSLVLLLVGIFGAAKANDDTNNLSNKGYLAITISAQKQNIEIYWRDLVILEDSAIVLMNGRLEDDGTEVLLQRIPTNTDDWITTDEHYDYRQFRDLIDVNTSCYGYWVYYRSTVNGTVWASSCLRAYPRWMNEIRDHIKDYRFRDIFIPGSHDSASYRTNFDPLKNETLVTKYTLTQDDDITSQLLHGIRYLDLRIGYYKRAEPQFWANHGISRQQPLVEVLRAVYDFVSETNEIVIIDFQEFPVGFGKTMTVHEKLVNFIKNEIGDMVIDFSETWRTNLSKIWSQYKRIVVSYDHVSVAEDYGPFTWMATQQRWANTANLSDLKVFLNRVNDENSFRFFSPRPVTDMAELTPDPWGVISDRYGGLRRLSDQTNKKISEWYFKEYGHTANIVAVDFFRGTTIVQTAVYWNVYRSQFRGDATTTTVAPNVGFEASDSG